MNFNFRRDGTWQTPTVKRRRGGQWVAASSGDMPDGEVIFASPMDSQSEIDSFSNHSHTSNISVASDPLGTNRDVASIYVGEGNVRGGTVSWAPNENRIPENTGEDDPDCVYSRYYVCFPEDTVMYNPDKSVHGTKLPGLAGFYDDTGYGGNEGHGRSWSARLQTDVAQESTSNSAFEMKYYAYHMDQYRSDGYGDELRWDGTYDFGKWHEVTLYVKMNTPGEYDGILRGWMNGDLAYEREDFRFRSTDNPNIGVTRAYAAYIYWGGSWGSPVSQNVYFRDFTLTDAT